MKYKALNLFWGVGLMLFLPLLSCQDEWVNHYDRSAELPNENLYDLIKQDSKLSVFSDILSKCGYDTLLSSSQAFTVWAPENAELAGLDYSDAKKAKQIAGNHISRFNYSTSTKLNKGIRMIDGKVYSFTSNGALEFGGSEILEGDFLAQNGILHKISDTIPYTNNIYEYMGATANTSGIANFLSTFDKLKFDKDLSIEISNKDGRVLYDTVYSNYNVLLKTPYFGLGNINSEDSLYTMLVPTNQAWNQAYARISPYFKSYNANAVMADSLQRVQTSLAIVSDLIYRQQITNPASLDTLVTTSGSTIRDVANLFQGAQKLNASNGLIYQTDSLRYKNWETWQKRIVVEGEVLNGREPGVNTAVFTRTTDANSLVDSIIGKRYIEVYATSPSTNPSITFEIPDVLAGKYNIYVVFVPGIIDGTNNSKETTKLLFELAYQKADGANTSIIYKTADLVTSPTQKTVMKVASNFSFPVSNYYDRMWYLDENHSMEDIVTTTTLMIKTNVTNKETTTYSRKFRIDQIILEPVRE